MIANNLWENKAVGEEDKSNKNTGARLLQKSQVYSWSYALRFAWFILVETVELNGI